MECPHASRCPGCPGIGLEYAVQLEQKRARLAGAFAPYPALSALPVTAVRGAEIAEGYRTRAKLVVGSGSELGLYARGSHRVVDVPECRVLGPRLATVARALRERLPAPFPLFAVDLRDADAGVLVSLIVGEAALRADLLRFADELVARAPEIASVAYSLRDADSPQLLGQGHVLLRGPEELPHGLPGLPWHLAAHGAFVQAHAGQAASLYHDIVSELERGLAGLRGRRILELYAGSGSLALALAARGAAVTAVEAFEPAATRIERAARAQGLTIAALAAGAERYLPAAAGERFDAVVVNPPRRGLAPSVREPLARLGAALIVYVSCNPRTLARDLDHLAQRGYRARGVSAWDMMPQSAAVEAQVVLEQTAERPALVVLHEADGLIAIDKPAHVTRAELLERLPRARGATPLHAMADGTSGVCLFATSGTFAGARFEHVALVRGVVREKGWIRRGSATRYVRQRVVGGHSLVSVYTEDARRERVREHLAAIGHPVLGDRQHGDARSNRHFEFKHGLDRAFLHSRAITLPRSERDLVLEAPLPGDLGAVLESLEQTAEATW